MIRNSAVLLVIGCALHVVVLAQVQVLDEPNANPGRPTISTPVTLTPVGYLQFESGFFGAENSPEFESRYSLISVMRLALSPRLEVLTSTEPIAHFTADDTRNATADYFLGVQGVLMHGKVQNQRCQSAILADFTTGPLPNQILEVRQTHFCSWPVPM
jgi:hypothetical protein